MPDRPLLILPPPAEPSTKGRKYGGPGRPHFPGRDRQAQRLGPRFAALQQAFDAHRALLRTAAAGLVPEQVIVLETAGSVDEFIVAVRNVEGLEWLGEIEEEDIPPDDDFFLEGREEGTRREGSLRGRVFMVLSNQHALRQLLSMWEAWKDGQTLPYGLRKWGDLFTRLRDVRPWGVRDRLIETGVLNDWQERVDHNEEVIPCEIELWYRHDPRRRRASAGRVVALVESLNGQALHEATVDEIGYHAVLARLPIGAVRTFLDEAGRDAELLHCEQIQFFRASGQMAGIIADDTRAADTGAIEETPTEMHEPVVALLDGLPLQGHRRLAGRLAVDDPDGFESQYPAAQRRHGTAMASLILHGDLDAHEPAISRRLYVCPILRPDPRDWRQSQEVVPEDVLVVDLIHRAVRRLFESEGDEPAAAPQVSVINLSIGIRDRPFENAMSPLARLIDWLAWKYGLLFIVSAGNHPHTIELDVPRAQLAALAPAGLQANVVRAVAADARNRRLLSPAEAMNVTTVGAVHKDSSSVPPVPGAIDPYFDGVSPAPFPLREWVIDGRSSRRSFHPAGGLCCARARNRARTRGSMPTFNLARRGNV